MSSSLAPVPTDVPRYRDGYELASSGVSVGYTDDWQRQHVLEDDGLCALLYQYLHKNIKGREDAMTSLRLPETVVFDHNFPRAWYAYDGENDEITKRPGKMLDAQTMYSYFSVPTPGCDVVAQFVHNTIRDDGAEPTTTTTTAAAAAAAAATHATTSTAVAVAPAAGEPHARSHAATDASRHGRLTYVEYFTADTLHTFLFQQRRKPDGVLQKFVLPRGSGSRRRNAQLHVLWSPIMTLVHSRVNRCCLDDTSASLATRCATYDGPGYLSEESLVADSTARRLDGVCRDMAEHVYRTEKKRLTRMSVYCKIGEDNKVWLLWCAGLRVAADALNPSYVRVPLAYDMRIELLNEGQNSAAQLTRRRERQRQLLLLDDALFAVSHDLAFALSVNASHKRQAHALGMGAPASPDRTSTPASATGAHTQHPLNESFVLLYGSADIPEREVCGTHHTSRRTPARRHVAKPHTAGGQGGGATQQRARGGAAQPPRHDDTRAVDAMLRQVSQRHHAGGGGSAAHRDAHHTQRQSSRQGSEDSRRSSSSSSSSSSEHDEEEEGEGLFAWDGYRHDAGTTRAHPQRVPCDATMRPRDAVVTAERAAAAAATTRSRRLGAGKTNVDGEGDGEAGGADEVDDDAAAVVVIVDAALRQRVREELTALALDACYAVYSYMLTHASRAREGAGSGNRAAAAAATAAAAGGGGGTVELATPLTTALTSDELVTLTRLLGLQPLHEAPGNAAASPLRYRIVRGTAREGADGAAHLGARETDAVVPCPPLVRAERDIDAFFERVFAQRGDAVARYVAEYHSEELCLFA